MPVTEELKVTFVGEDGSLSKSLGSLQGQLKRFEKGLAEATNTESFNRLQRAIDATKKRIESMQTGNATGSMRSLSSTSNLATQSLNNLSRVAQDMPFGFIGISNNLNPLLEGFQRLSVQAKESGTSVKSALVASLTGAGGLGLALGVVSAGLTIMQMGLGAWTRGLSSSGEQVKEFDASMDRLNATLEKTKDRLDDIRDGLNFSNQLGTINNELAGLAKSVDIGGQVISIRERIPEVKAEIDELAPQYARLKVLLESFAALGDDEKDKVRKEFSFGDISDAETVKQLQRQYDAVNETLDKARKQYNDLQNQQTQLQLQVRLERKKEAEEAAKDAEEARKKAEAAHKKLLKEMERRNKEILDARHKFLAAMRSATIKFDSPTDFFKNLNKEEAEKANPDFEKYVKTQFANKIVVAPQPIVDLQTPIFTGVDLKKVIAIKYATDVNAAIEQALRNISVEGFSAIGEAIGNALSGQGIGDAFQQLGNFLGNALQALGKQMIALAPIMELIKSSIRALDPTKGLLSGIALVAIGGMFKNALKVPGLAQGGIIPGGFPNDTFPAMLSSGEAVIPLDKLGSIFGNMGPQVIILNQRFRGSDMYLMQAREGRKQRRGG